MEMTRREFGATLLASAAAMLVWGCRRRGSAAVRRAQTSGRMRFPGRVVPLDVAKVRQCGPWSG